ncbi:MAG: YfhO family protein, partial [Bacteroidota bacterium]
MLSAYLKKYPTAAPVLFLVFMIILPYWKLATMQGFIITDDVFTSDIMNEGFPYRHYISEALKNGELPTWLPYIYGGIPLLARAEAGVCYPLNLLLFGLMSPYVALNLVILLTLITAALAMYFYARELEAETVGAIVAGLAFAYSGFMVSHIKHLSMVGTVCWFPLGLLIIERAVRRSSPKTLLWLSLVFGLQNLSGHTQTAYYSGLIYLCYFVFRLLSLREKAAPRKRKSKPPATLVVQLQPLKSQVFWFAIAMILAVGISAIQLLPTYELVGLTQRSGGVTFDYAASYAYDPSNIKTFFYPHANGDISNATYKGKSIFWEDYGYVGLVILLLAIFAAAKCWRRWHVRFFAITSIAAYVLVLGPNTPLYEAVFYLVPGMKFFRFPTRFLFIVDVSLAVLAALGMTQLFVNSRDAVENPEKELKPQRTQRTRRNLPKKTI